MAGNADTTGVTTIISEKYDYEFSNSQVVARAPYSGLHIDNLTAQTTVREVAASDDEI